MADTRDPLQFAISSSFENVADLAERVSLACSAHPATDPDSTDTLRLCLAEALNNIVEHAYDGAEGRPIFADVRLETDRYEVLLIDEGKPMPEGRLPDGQVDYDWADVENLPEGGFGWLLIRSQMDVVEYERRDGCNVLRLAKHLGA